MLPLRLLYWQCVFLWLKYFLLIDCKYEKYKNKLFSLWEVASAHLLITYVYFICTCGSEWCTGIQMLIFASGSFLFQFVYIVMEYAGMCVESVNKQSVHSDGVCHYISGCKLCCTGLHMEPKVWCTKAESTMYSCISMSTYEPIFSINYEKHTFQVSCLFLLSLDLSNRLQNQKWVVCMQIFTWWFTQWLERS